MRDLCELESTFAATARMNALVRGSESAVFMPPRDHNDRASHEAQEHENKANAHILIIVLI